MIRIDGSFGEGGGKLAHGEMFVGKKCSLCTNSNWDLRSKGIK